MKNKAKKRCDWSLGHPLLTEYHDNEWGTPVHDEKRHFEFLCLESMQAGLSWLIILKKRKIIEKAFDKFDYKKIARYTEKKIQKIMSMEGMIKYRKKIEAVINNARMFIKIQKEFGSFDKYIWEFVENKPVVNKYKKESSIPAKTELSIKITKDLKKRGFKFLGPIVVYSHLQATGIVNDHLVSCYRYRELKNCATDVQI